MKKLFFIFFSIMLLSSSCSKDDDCTGNYNEINQSYQIQIDYIKNNPEPGWGVDYRKIGILENERNKKLANACK